MMKTQKSTKEIVDGINRLSEFFASIGNSEWQKAYSLWASKINLSFNPEATLIEFSRSVCMASGMMSIGDVYISAGNGHNVKPGEEANLNSKLVTLVSELRFLVGSYLNT